MELETEGIGFWPYECFVEVSTSSIGVHQQHRRPPHCDKHNPRPHEKKTVTVWEIQGMEPHSQAMSQWRGSRWKDKNGREDRIKRIVTVLSYCKRQVTKKKIVSREILMIYSLIIIIVNELSKAMFYNTIKYDKFIVCFHLQLIM